MPYRLPGATARAFYAVGPRTPHLTRTRLRLRPAAWKKFAEEEHGNVYRTLVDGSDSRLKKNTLSPLLIPYRLPYSVLCACPTDQATSADDLLPVARN